MMIVRKKKPLKHVSMNGNIVVSGVFLVWNNVYELVIIHNESELATKKIANYTIEIVVIGGIDRKMFYDFGNV